MYTLFKFLQFTPLLAVTVTAAADYPALPQDLSTPYQQRLAISGMNSVSVGWNTYQQLTKPCVYYGTKEANLSMESCSTISVTYNTSRTWSNTVYLTDLTPATKYYYKIESTNSSVENFLSPRTPGDKTPFTTSVVIDLGVYGADGFTVDAMEDPSRKRFIPDVDPSLNHSTIGRLAETWDDYEWVLHPGDFAYADDWYLVSDLIMDGTNAYEAILENFYDQLAPIAGGKVYMASPGNHEADCNEIVGSSCPEGQNNFTDFHVRFGQNMPTSFSSTSKSAQAKVNANKAAQLANPPFWYSFEYGMVHVTMIDTETDFTGAANNGYSAYGTSGGPFGYTGQQVEFFEADLASVDRNVTPWLVVAGHRPFYSTGTANACSACQAAFEPAMYKYGADIGVWGHVHNSQRFLPMYNGTIDPAGMNNPTAPMSIIAGGAGNIEGLSSIGSNATGNVFAYAGGFSYATLTFEDENNLRIDFYSSDTGALLETSTLYKNHTEQFPNIESVVLPNQTESVKPSKPWWSWR